MIEGFAGRVPIGKALGLFPAVTLPRVPINLSRWCHEQVHPVQSSCLLAFASVYLSLASEVLVRCPLNHISDV